MADAREAANDEHFQVYKWRRHILLEAGYPASAASRLAESDVDLHLAERIVKEGCDPRLAVEILT